MECPAIYINIFTIKINSFENCSAVNIGQNLMADWTSYDKKNQGFGQTMGDNSDILGIRSLVDDRDLNDFPALKAGGVV